ncbi:MAG TPA: hypothetical protein VIM64_14070 [Puia sp.]
MRPDYPFKIFSDKRTRYCLRMQMLAAYQEPLVAVRPKDRH